jgi:hypothetical protein
MFIIFALHSVLCFFSILFYCLSYICLYNSFIAIALWQVAVFFHSLIRNDTFHLVEIMSDCLFMRKICQKCAVLKILIRFAVLAKLKKKCIKKKEKRQRDQLFKTIRNYFRELHAGQL